MNAIQLAFSPCPNDTFIFYAMVFGKVDLEGLRFNFVTADVEALNQSAMKGIPDMVKVSYHAWLYLRAKYELLNSGSALGFSNGPLLISKKPIPVDELAAKTIAIPGEFTTAHLLLKFFLPSFHKKIMVFDEIEGSILREEADAGVIIHENRFTYEKRGLQKIADLGEYWQNMTGTPIPLGGILAKKELGEEMISRLNRIMHRSVVYAREHPEETMDFVRSNAQEMDEEVMKKHIRLYVNDFTVDLGKEGREAIAKLNEYEEQLIRGRDR
ncbi:MAG TPA: 1,4-dihydroxy-6-naphthoate synthase [Bacteroidales bacterium]|nr:1,4-dihydroxy-6-naphthoate synthase [Bacteroidales bacterium]